MHVEPELEALLMRLVPGCRDRWLGAPDDELELLEVYADLDIPPFFQWFLTNMGRSMGPLAVRGRDMTAATLLSIYEQDFFPPDPNLLLIGVETDEVMPMYLYCDLSRPTRNDALVCSHHPLGGFRQNEFETLRDMIAWDAFTRFRTARCERICSGTFRATGDGVLATLEPALIALGFTRSIPGGSFLGLYERDDVALECRVPPPVSCDYIFFDIGADDEATLRSILGTIVVETPVQVEIRTWTPPISG